MSEIKTKTGASVREQTVCYWPTRRRKWPCPPFPVRTAKDHDRAIAILDDLVPLEKPSAEQQAFIDVMIPVVEAYEARNETIDTSGVTPLEILKRLVEEHGMSAAELGRLLGNRSVGGALLRGERKMSKKHIAILAERFRLDPGIFLER